MEAEGEIEPEMLSLTTQVFITTSRYCDTNHIWVQKNNTWITANWALRFSFPNFISTLHHPHLHWWLLEKGNRNNWWTLVQWECLQVQLLYIFPSSGVCNLASLLPISTEARAFLWSGNYSRLTLMLGIYDGAKTATTTSDCYAYNLATYSDTTITIVHELSLQFKFCTR